MWGPASCRHPSTDRLSSAAQVWHQLSPWWPRRCSVSVKGHADGLAGGDGLPEATAPEAKCWAWGSFFCGHGRRDVAAMVTGQSEPRSSRRAAEERLAGASAWAQCGGAAWRHVDRGAAMSREPQTSTHNLLAQTTQRCCGPRRRPTMGCGVTPRRWRRADPNARVFRAAVAAGARGAWLRWSCAAGPRRAYRCRARCALRVWRRWCRPWRRETGRTCRPQAGGRAAAAFAITGRGGDDRLGRSSGGSLATLWAVH